MPPIFLNEYPPSASTLWSVCFEVSFTGWAMNGPWDRNVTANITPHPNTFVGQTTRELFIARFKGFAKMADPEEQRPAQPGMNTIMPWIAFSGMTEQDLGAIYDYLHTEVKPIANEVVCFPDARTTK